MAVISDTSEDWEAFSTGPIYDSFGGGFINMPGWSVSGGSAASKGILTAFSPDGLSVTDALSHSGSKSIRATDLTFTSTSIQVSSGTSISSNSIIDMSCWYYRSSSFASSSYWHINYSGGGGIRAVGSPGALDWGLSVNGNSVGLVNNHGTYLNPSTYALNNYHLLAETNKPSPNRWIGIDTGVYAWDRWLKQTFRFNPVSGKYTMGIEDESSVLWSHTFTNTDINDTITSASLYYGVGLLRDLPGGDTSAFEVLDDVRAIRRDWEPPPMGRGRILVNPDGATLKDRWVFADGRD